MTADDDDIPWADPAIRIDYEAALGRFILAFNEVDYRLGEVIQFELIKRKRSDLLTRALEGTFAQRLDTLEMLVTNTKESSLLALPLGRLRGLNAARNTLAHGHFDQNPFDGSYSVVQKKKTVDYPTPHILELAAELTQIAVQFRHAGILYAFEDVTGHAE